MKNEREEIENLFRRLWKKFVMINPRMNQVRSLFSHKGGGLPVNDHVALRTISHPVINVEAIASPLEELGYKSGGE